MLNALGRLLRPLHADPDRSPLGHALQAPTTITVTSPSFENDGPMPRRDAGHGVGEDISPELDWQGVPSETVALLVVLEDIDVPLPKPLLHSVAVVEPGISGLSEGAFTVGTAGVRIVPTLLGKTGYSGPRPIPGHGPHRYRFHVLALDHAAPSADSAKTVLRDAGDHVLARGSLTGTYERN